MPQGLAIDLEDDGWTLDIEVSDVDTFPASRRFELKGLLDTGCDVLVIEKELLQKFEMQGVVKDQTKGHTTITVNGTTEQAWWLCFRCSSANLKHRVQTVFLPLKAMGFDHEALVGRRCLVGAKFIYDDPADLVAFV